MPLLPGEGHALNGGEDFLARLTAKGIGAPAKSCRCERAPSSSHAVEAFPLAPFQFARGAQNLNAAQVLFQAGEWKITRWIENTREREDQEGGGDWAR